MFFHRCRALAVLSCMLSGSLLVNAQQPQPAPITSPTTAEALKALAAAREEAAKIGVKLSCAVVDSRGDLVALTRMDGARFFTAEVARGKAQISAMFGEPSGNLVQFGASPAFANLNTVAQGHLYPVQGAVPISRKNEIIGAIGCSGGASSQDEAAAKAGLAEFK